jgi:hypothetical protein
MDDDGAGSGVDDGLPEVYSMNSPGSERLAGFVLEWWLGM